MKLPKVPREERIVNSAIRLITLEKGVYSKPSQIRALLRSSEYFITKRGAVRRNKLISNSK